MNKTISLTEVKARNLKWFSADNKKFFGDLRYWVLHQKGTNKPHLVRLTNAWTDMFGKEKEPHYRVNEITNDLKIGELNDRIFKSLREVKEWLK
jgi:hypothetical protein|tara:strand:+ start:413 stop:694 length:282 start_codon:yes stop_codon:yes gene_type:complete